jgi:predicted aspartyl protease
MDVREAVRRKVSPAVLAAALAVAAPMVAAAEEGAAPSGDTVMSAELLEGAAVGAEAKGLHVHADVRAAASAEEGEPVFAGLFRVDTGASDSIAPASALEAIGIVPAGVGDFERADGTVEQYSYGLVRIEFLGEMREGRVFFGPEDVEPAIGTAALEAAGLTVDPETKTLQRANAGE